MGEFLVPGTLAAYEDSMAAEIEKAMNELLIDAGKDPLPDDEDAEQTLERRRFFIAIARGVIRHLDINQKAFVIHVPPPADLPETVTPDIQTLP